MGYGQPDFEIFFLEQFERIVRSLTAITSDEETARDCTQDAFVKAATRWRKVRRLDNPGAWVRRVAINRSRDLYRGDQRRRHRESTQAPTEQQASAEPACVAALGMVELLQQLPPRQRAAAALFYVDDLPVVEIASILGISDGAVKFHLSKARRALRASMEREGDRHE